MNKKYKTAYYLSITTFVTTIVSHGLVMWTTIMNEPFSKLIEQASKYMKYLPSEFTNYLNLINQYVEYSQTLVFSISLILIITSILLPLLCITIIILNTKKISIHNGLARYFLLSLISIILVYISLTDLSSSNLILPLYELIKINTLLILVMSSYVLTISIFHIVNKIKNDSYYTIEKITSNTLKIMSICISVILGFKIISMFITYLIFIQVINLIDFGTWINISNIQNNVTMLTLFDVLPQSLKSILEFVPVVKELPIFEFSLNSVDLNSVFDIYIFDQISNILRSILILIFKPLIFNNFSYYVIGFLISCTLIYIDNMNKKLVSVKMKLLIRAILLVLLMVLFLMFFVSSYSLYILLGLFLVLLGTLYTLFSEED